MPGFQWIPWDFHNFTLRLQHDPPAETTSLRDGGLIATGSFIHLGLVLSDFQLEHPTDLEKDGTSLWKNTTGISTSIHILYILHIYIIII